MLTSCSTCCLGPLPVVRVPADALAHRATFTTSIAPLLDGLEAVYSPLQLTILKSRFLAIIDSAERDAIRSDWWDTRLFMLGFGGSLLVTIAAAIGQAGYMTPSAVTIVNTLVLLLSSIGTAALGLRERLKFREAADISKRLSSALQQRGFLFLSASGKYADMSADQRFQAFIVDVENHKMRSDEEHQALRTQEDVHQGTNGGGAPPMSPWGASMRQMGTSSVLQSAAMPPPPVPRAVSVAMSARAPLLAAATTVSTTAASMGACEEDCATTFT
jgi:hypothetical protein